MNTIEKIRERLRQYPELSFRETATSITVEPSSPSGFPVNLHTELGDFTVSFDGWHEHFDSEEEALNCFAFGLSDCCRLKVFLRGRTKYRWTLESRSGEGWTEDSTHGLLVFPFWRKSKVIILQNSAIRVPEDGSKR